MNKKMKCFVVIIGSIMVILILLFLYSIFDIDDGYTGKRDISENEKVEIIDFFERYYGSNNREEYIFANDINEKKFFVAKPTEVVMNWEILDSSFFTEHIFDDPVDNQYVINVKVRYSSEDCETRETFHLVKEDKKWKILWLYP